MIAHSENLITWERVGAIVQGEDNKDHVLFPRKINDQFAAFHRRWPEIWIAYSKDYNLFLLRKFMNLYIFL